MMNSKTYISDPKIWEAFYKNMAEKKFNPYIYKPKQIGRGMRSEKSNVIPIRSHSQLEPVIPIPQVPPVAVVEKRAKTEHLKDVKNGYPFVKTTRGIKRQRKQPYGIPKNKTEDGNITEEQEKIWLKQKGYCNEKENKWNIKETTAIRG